MEHSFIPPARPLIGDDERSAVDRVLVSGQVAQGPEVEAFEQEFAAELVQGRTTVAVNSGTSGQHLGLIASGIGPGDEVIVPSFTFAATANSVVLAGATPVFVDIEPRYFSLDPALIREAITPRTRAIMPVHLYGHPFLVDQIESLAAEFELKIFEDAAQAHGASWGGRSVGTIGDFAMFSLYPTKNMTSGEGGMVTCKTEETARTVRLLRNQGMERQYENEIVGFNVRMTDIHAAIGRVQLKRINEWTQIRQRNAEFLNHGLEDLPGVTLPTVAANAVHVYHQYTIRVDEVDRDRVRSAMKERFGVGTGVYYPTPSHDLPSLKRFAPAGVLRETEKASKEVLSLPVYPSLTEEELTRIVRAVRSCV